MRQLFELTRWPHLYKNTVHDSDATVSVSHWNVKP